MSSIPDRGFYAPAVTRLRRSHRPAMTSRGGHFLANVGNSESCLDATVTLNERSCSKRCGPLSAVDILDLSKAGHESTASLCSDHTQEGNAGK
jgi:hypothetical protein